MCICSSTPYLDWGVLSLVPASQKVSSNSPESVDCYLDLCLSHHSLLYHKKCTAHTYIKDFYTFQFISKYPLASECLACSNRDIERAYWHSRLHLIAQTTEPPSTLGVDALTRVDRETDFFEGSTICAPAVTEAIASSQFYALEKRCSKAS